MNQIGTCVVYKRHGCYPAARCTQCEWATERIYEDDLARAVAEHSVLHTLARTQTTGSIKITLNGEPV